MSAASYGCPHREGVYLYDMSTIGGQSHQVHQQSASAGGSQEAWVAYNSRYVVLEQEDIRKLIVEMVTHICKSTKEEPHRTARL